MRILEHRSLPGPNPYSPYPTIHMQLDLEELADTTSADIEGFPARLAAAIPSLREHRCSEGHEGGFLERLRDGTLMGHVVEHVALELQCLAGIRVGFGKTRATKEPGVYRVVYRYREERSGLMAGRAAVDLVQSLARACRAGNGPSPAPLAATQDPPVPDAAEVAAMVRDIRASYDDHRLGPSTQSIVQEARRRGIPVMRLDSASYIQLGQGANQRRMQATLTSRTACIGTEIADDKDRTKAILHDAGIPVPRGLPARTVEDALEAAAELGYPVVTKPRTGNHGRGITTAIADDASLAAAFARAQQVDATVLVERHIAGADFRVLVVDHKFVAAARRDPAQVTGDGKRSVAELVAEANRDPRRGDGHENAMTRISLDEGTRELLARQGLDTMSIPPAGRQVILKGTANMSTGGSATDVTAEVHPQVQRMCERASRLVGLDIMGLDIVAPTLAEPLSESGGAIVEVNAAPGLRMHAQPSHGRPRNVAARIVDMLFPHGAAARIPIVAVTGTNGKTTTVRLVSHILAQNGARVGMASTTGVVIEGEPVVSGDYSGPDGARVVLQDSAVDHAVLEVARGGILRRGLGFDTCDVGVFLNVASDHLGEGGVDTIEDLAEVKAVVVESVSRTGTAVLNADDPLVARYRDSLRARCVLFSLEPQSEVVATHLARNGLVVTVHNGDVVLRDAEGDQIVTAVARCPITFDGAARFNVQNVLAATAACHALRVPVEVMRAGLESFTPTPENLPGRLNLIDMGSHRVLVDYGHNVPALEALAPVVAGLKAARRVAVASASGNRRDEDIQAFGAMLARMYDRILVCDPDPRGRQPGETAAVLHRALESGGARDVQVFLEERDAVELALSQAQPGDLIVLQVDDVKATLERVTQAAGLDAGGTGMTRPRRRPLRRPELEATHSP